jgi:hypothetical protein
MEYMSNLPSTKQGNDYVFVVVDRFSKMAILVTYKKSIIAEATTKLFFERVWVHFGIPKTIVLDRDNEFLNTFWSSLWSRMDTKITKSMAFHPQMNGQNRGHQQDDCAYQHILQQVQDILQKSNAKYKQCHDQHSMPHKFKVGDKVWLHL